MVQVSYPGVYIQEVSSGVHTITSVATSITAFVDFFRNGPMNQAVEIFGMTDFTRVFGGMDARSEASYAIAQFFQNGGGSALVIRVAGSDGTHPLSTATVKIKPTTTGAGGDVLEVRAASPGIWGNNLRVFLDSRTADPSKFFNLTVVRYDGPGGTARPIGSERFINLSLDSASPRYALEVVNADSKLVQLFPGSAMMATSIPLGCGTTGADISSGLTPTQLQALLNGFSAGKFRVTLAGTQYTCTLETWTAGTVSSLAQLANRVERAIRTAVNSTDATAPTPAGLTAATVSLVGGIGVTGGAKLVAVVGGGDTDYNPLNRLTFANDGATTVAADLKLTGAGVLENVTEYPVGSTAANVAAYLKGATGADGIAPGPDQIVGAVAEANNEGLFALEKADLFNILCLPVAATMSDTEMTTVISKALAYCEKKRAFLLLDIPASINEPAEVKAWLDAPAHAGFRHKNAAIYFPRPQIADPLADYRLTSRGASGTMAGIYARTDGERGVWKAPAGVDAGLSGVSQLDYKLTDAENGTLNPLGINCLRTFPVYGNLAWGARTLVGADQMASEWKYVPIRRLALMLEESLFRGTKWVVFEPNDEPLWANIRLNLNAFMMSLFRQGAFQGTAPKDAFFVKCDSETTTQDDRNKGIVNIIVGFAPLKPAEFVVISIQQIAGQL